MGNFFTGVPIPAGAVLVMLPIYLEHVGVPRGLIHPWLVTGYTMAIALLMVSKLPVFSGKKVGSRVPREMVLPLFVAAIAFVALLISYPWAVLAVGSVLYLGSLPFGVAKARELAQAEAAAKAAGLVEPAALPTEPPDPAEGR
jgi:CDP-diacylglycerol--serine O-phosphatidyltransferase